MKVNVQIYACIYFGINTECKKILFLPQVFHVNFPLSFLTCIFLFRKGILRKSYPPYLIYIVFEHEIHLYFFCVEILWIKIMILVELFLKHGFPIFHKNLRIQWPNQYASTKLQYLQTLRYYYFFTKTPHKLCLLGVNVRYFGTVLRITVRYFEIR